MRCGTGGTPAGSLVDGKVADPSGVGNALIQLLARSEIHESRALVAVSDSLATFRILNLPVATPDSNVESVVAKELPFDQDRMAMKWVDVHRNSQSRTVFATAWDRAQVRALGDAVRAARLEPVTIDLKSACLARTVLHASCILVDVASTPAEMVLIDNHLPQVWQRLDSGFQIDDPVPGLLEPLRAVVRYAGRNRDSGLGPDAPVVISSDQPPSQGAMADLARTIQRPVEALSMPPRVPDIRFATYLTCIGLLMRRA